MPFPLHIALNAIIKSQSRNDFFPRYNLFLISVTYVKHVLSGTNFSKFIGIVLAKPLIILFGKVELS